MILGVLKQHRVLHDCYELPFRELSMNSTILSAASTVMLQECEEDGGDQRSKDLLDTGQNGLAKEQQLEDEKLLKKVVGKMEAYEKSDSFNH